MTESTTRMRAVLLERPGGPETMWIGQVGKPVPRTGELLVKVHATALNRADLMQREGRYPPPPGASQILGLEMAGVVESKGPECGGWEAGDRVFGLLAGGGYAEYVLIHHDLAIPIPSSFSFAEAAAIPEVFLTAFQALHWNADLAAGKRVLIHAGASGVGTAAIQLVRAAGATPYVTVSAAKREACMALGAEAAIDYNSADFAERIPAITGGVDIVVDFIGGPYFTRNVECLAEDGCVVILATLGGSQVDGFDLRRLFRKRGRIITSTLRNRSLEYKAKLTQDFAAYALPLFETEVLKPVIDCIYDWADVADAHRYMEDNRNVGKIVLQVTG